MMYQPWSSVQQHAQVAALLPTLEQYLERALQPGNCCSVLDTCHDPTTAPLVQIMLGYIRGR